MMHVETLTAYRPDEYPFPAQPINAIIRSPTGRVLMGMFTVEIVVFGSFPMLAC
jgi:hypothetical protein